MDSKCRPLLRDVTTLPTEPQPLPGLEYSIRSSLSGNLKICIMSLFKLCRFQLKSKFVQFWVKIFSRKRGGIIQIWTKGKISSSCWLAMKRFGEGMVLTYPPLGSQQRVFLMGQPRPLLSFIFGLFKQTSLQFLQQIYVKKCPSSIRCGDSNPKRSFYIKSVTNNNLGATIAKWIRLHLTSSGPGSIPGTTWTLFQLKF